MINLTTGRPVLGRPVESRPRFKQSNFVCLIIVESRDLLLKNNRSSYF